MTDKSDDEAGSGTAAIVQGHGYLLAHGATRIQALFGFQLIVAFSRDFDPKLSTSQ